MSVPYKRIKNAFGRLKDANPRIGRIYTLRETATPGKLQFVMDVGDPSGLTAAVGCPLKAAKYPRMLEAFDQPTADVRVRTDKWGNWLSAYCPIRDARRRTVAIIAIDMRADYTMQEERGLGYAAACAFSIAVALTLALSLVVSSRVTRPVRELTAATRHIAEGNLDYDIPVDSMDEIGELAHSFKQMLKSLKESHTRLLNKANTDGMTGLFNHRYLCERLGHEVRRSVRYGRSLAILMIDVDGLKPINDAYGHSAGDAVIRKTAALVTASIREVDTATRYGGDEFAVILPETNVEHALLTAERIRAAVESAPQALQPSDESAEDTEAKPLPSVTVSIGIAVCPDHSMECDPLLAAADIAMYQAKRSSQNAVCVYDSVPGAGSVADPCRIQVFLQSANVSAIAALAADLDAEDPFAKGHSQAVAEYALAIAEELCPPEEEKFSIRIAALLHDVGKVGTPDKILNRPGKLSVEQLDVIRTHPAVGGRLVKQVPQLNNVLPGILYHHENYDGTGYPCGLKGDQIPLIARIIAVADAFKAMTSERPYREAKSSQEAIVELQAHSGAQFDPQIVDVFIHWLQTRGRERSAA